MANSRSFGVQRPPKNGIRWTDLFAIVINGVGANPGEPELRKYWEPLAVGTVMARPPEKANVSIWSRRHFNAMVRSPISPSDVFVLPSKNTLLSIVVAIGKRISNDIMPPRNVFSKPGVYAFTPILGLMVGLLEGLMGTL